VLEDLAAADQPPRHRRRDLHRRQHKVLQRQLQADGALRRGEQRLEAGLLGAAALVGRQGALRQLARAGLIPGPAPPQRLQHTVRRRRVGAGDRGRCGGRSLGGALGF